MFLLYKLGGINKLALLSSLFLIMFVCFFAISANLTPKVSAAQKGFAYKMPWRYNEVWDSIGEFGPAYHYGTHTDSTGFAFDFTAPIGSTKDVLAVGDGVITRGCTAGNATFLTLNTFAGDTFRYVHLRVDTVPIGIGGSKRVAQGEVLGKVYGKGFYQTATCKLSTDDSHLHFSWLGSACPLRIEGYTFTCDGLKNNCSGVYLVRCNERLTGLRFISTNGRPDKIYPISAAVQNPLDDKVIRVVRRRMISF